MQRTRTTSSGATYVASAAPATTPSSHKHLSSATTYSPPSTASTASAAQYTKPPLNKPAAPRRGGGGTPAAPGASATGTFGARAARDGEDEAQFTFYREGTPTPSERSVETRWEKTGRRMSTRMGVMLSSVGFPAVERAPERLAGERRDGGSGGGGGSWGGDGAREREERERRRRRICGVPAGMFWCLVIGVGMLVIGLAVGLGLGLGLKSNDEGDAASATEPSANPSASASPTSTTPSYLPTTFDTSALPTTTKIDCTDSDGHLYLMPRTSKSFLIRCGIDYSSDFGPTVELGQALASDMEECVAHCVAADGCTACGWGFIDGDKGDQHRCWLKGRLSTEHRARANWTFAIMQGD